MQNGTWSKELRDQYSFNTREKVFFKKKLPISSLNKEKKFRLTKYNHLTKIWPENNVTTVQFVIHVLMLTCQHMDLSLKIIPRKSEASEIISFNNIFRRVYF